MRILLQGGAPGLIPIELMPSKQDEIGQGAEGTVYVFPKVRPGQAVKVFRAAIDLDTADAASCPALLAQLGAKARKLQMPWSTLPTELTRPTELVTTPDGKTIIGYCMDLLGKGQRLSKFRGLHLKKRQNPVEIAAFLAACGSLIRITAALHPQGVLIGDVIDRNVHVETAGSIRARLMDVDSMQRSYRDPSGKVIVLPCRTYSPEFVDPKRFSRQKGGPVYLGPTPASDWFAIAAMIWEILSGVGPYEGFYEVRAANGKMQEVKEELRREQGISVFDARVEYPEPHNAFPIKLFPPEFIDYLTAVFSHRFRETTSATTRLERLVAGLRWNECSRCKLWHFRASCPDCQSSVQTSRLVPSPPSKPRTPRPYTHRVLLPGGAVAVTVNRGTLSWLARSGPSGLCQGVLTSPVSIVPHKGAVLPGVVFDPTAQYTVCGPAVTSVRGSALSFYRTGQQPVKMLLDPDHQAPSTLGEGLLVLIQGGMVKRGKAPPIDFRTLGGKLSLFAGSKFGLVLRQDVRPGANPIWSAYTYEVNGPAVTAVTGFPQFPGRLESIRALFDKTVDTSGGTPIETGYCWLLCSGQTSSGEPWYSAIVVREDGVIEATSQKVGSKGDNWLSSATMEACVMDNRLYQPQPTGYIERWSLHNDRFSLTDRIYEAHKQVRGQGILPRLYLAPGGFYLVRGGGIEYLEIKK